MEKVRLKEDEIYYNYRSNKEHKSNRRTVSECNIKYTGITSETFKDVCECQISHNLEKGQKLKKIKKPKAE